MPRDAVIFDLFGTLIDGVPPREYAWTVSRVAAALGAPREAFIRLWNDTLDQRLAGVFPTTQNRLAQICRKLEVSAGPTRLERGARILRDLVQAALVPRPRVIDTLILLKEQGYRVGLVSDAPPEVPALWPASPFAPYVDAPIFSCAVGLKKPDGAIYHAACDGLGVPPGRCLYVADGTGRELTGAVRAGLSAVLLRGPFREAGTREQDALDWPGPVICEVPEILDIVTAVRHEPTPPGQPVRIRE